MAGETDNYETLLRGIVAFQSLFRGFRTRKAMQAIRNDFALIFNEIEGEESDMFDVMWDTHSVIGRPSIKQSRHKDSMIKTESCKNEVKINGNNTTDRASEAILDGVEVEMDASEKNDCEYREGGSPSSDNLLTSSLKNGSEKHEKTDNGQHIELRGYKDRFNEDLTTSGESFSDSLLQPGIRKPNNTNKETESQKVKQNASIHKGNDTKLDIWDDTTLQSLTLDNLRSMTKEGLFQKEKEIQMELLWIQQAIESRKQYIDLKG